jgi:signal transduction histidine kinase
MSKDVPVRAPADTWSADLTNPAIAAPPNPDDLLRVEQLLVEFERLEQQFQQVRDSLMHSHRLATLGTIATIIAHEFNNILTPMISYSQLALSQPNDAALMRKAVEKALAGAERAAKISSSLLGFAREADQQHAADVRATIDEAIACLARDPKKDNVDLSIDVPDVRVAMSSVNLQQVILNLVLNAKQAMDRQGARKGGKLAITGRVKGNLVHLAVSDTGPGIPPQIRDRLFEPFVTQRDGVERSGRGGAGADDAAGGSDGDGAPAERKGTGLGLCICRDLVRAAGGSIHVESTPGHGATFHLMIPQAEELFETT